MRTIQTKQSISAYVALAYLNGLYCNVADLLEDDEYNRAFKALENRVNELLDDGVETDIIDQYVVVEHQPRIGFRTKHCDVATTGAQDVR